MLKQNEKPIRQDLVSEAYYEWREAANAWSTLYDRIKHDPRGVSTKHRRRLQNLETRLNRASDRYTRERLNAK
jgi:hypothetical protein